MKSMMQFLLVFSIQVVSSLSLYSQAIPDDSLYLGQIQPSYTPKIFQLPKSSGNFTAERIAISPDNKEIFYTELNGYPPTVSKIKYFNYSNNKWNGAFTLFQGYIAPGLSPSGAMLYFQDNQTNSWYSVKTGTTWSAPFRFWDSAHKQHYLQATNTGKYYMTSDPLISSIGDLSELRILDPDTTVQNLGVPINSANNGLDFFIAEDESFIIRVIRNNGIGDLYISYHKPDGGWTNPKNLGSQVNSSEGWEWGPYVTADNKFLFFTRQIASVGLYWVRVDNLIDSLRLTNFIPYLKTPIPNQTANKGSLFTYQFPDSTFIDDDGNNTLIYSATLSNGNPLPSWLSFNGATRTFSGVPVDVATIDVKITAMDTANVVVSCAFTVIARLHYPITPTSSSYSSSGGTGTVSVLADSGYSWTAASNETWISFTSGGSGSGNGSVEYSVSTNLDSNSRTGTMTIAENTFTVNQAAARYTHKFSLSNRWNLVSLPLNAGDSRTSFLFPTATSRASAYIPGTGYIKQDSLRCGAGYWLKMPDDQTVTLYGLGITADTIDVRQGWNLIGSVSMPVPTSSITGEPEGLVTSQFFCYDRSYVTRDTIFPGKGYWVKVDRNGSLIMSSVDAGLAKLSASRVRIIPTSELPPPAPDESDATIEIPKHYALEQNYPNPFNPVTVFRYQLPFGTKVTLKIYDLLGQEIKTLVDGWQDAGFKTVTWDANMFASGVYFYRINAGGFIQTRKLILLK